ncbi:hypothetical protein WJ0W_006213 [Paenibacillus melissococcoides]|uniref:Tail assembly chaperone n=1 Tax=Paenibacillus melissococcoides TaxID=2912268 RepID=A0ABM9GB61_9BACL|nr:MULTISPECIES: hypothetical protein [Paenibacillus]CAH8246852.1 hypothetical protein WJ0W_004084 [Paenibacillus melissococcoides]CAH8249026.1 hypothetical protein WJ0W_006213 [Paenibacillus melissococcoides]CAH8710751.1 hypothetical protein HTL2_002737 [Paenibacillus melissococcoides]CAH8715951.1 hypothetical protein HTL2_004454 [Paenibacillus melissococcoides]CAH8716905.1 hypothetical protein WDD9_004721 [Paenibacillus melissococcoides]
MAKTIDITSRLTNERPVLKLGEGKEYRIDNRKNTVLAIQAKMDAGDGSLDEVLELALGKEAVKEINESDISFGDYQVILIAALAGAMNEDYEVIEARFLAAKQETT